MIHLSGKTIGLLRTFTLHSTEHPYIKKLIHPASSAYLHCQSHSQVRFTSSFITALLKLMNQDISVGNPTLFRLAKSIEKNIAKK